MEKRGQRRPAARSAATAPASAAARRGSTRRRRRSGRRGRSACRPYCRRPSTPRRRASARNGPGARVAPARRGDDAHARQRDAGAEHLRPRRPLAEADRREQDGEKDLHLNDQRGEPDRHAQPHGQKQQPELADPDQRPIERDEPPRRRRAASRKIPAGKAAKAKRSAVSRNGGASSTPYLMAMNVRPQTTAATSAASDVERPQGFLSFSAARRFSIILTAITEPS